MRESRPSLEQGQLSEEGRARGRRAEQVWRQERSENTQKILLGRKALNGSGKPDGSLDDSASREVMCTGDALSLRELPKGRRRHSVMKDKGITSSSYRFLLNKR